MKKKPYHHDNLKIELIEKGIEIVNKEGVLHFSLRKVASACGVSHAAPYSHFNSKEELLNAMQEHITEQFSKLLESILEKYNDDSQILKYLGTAYIQFFLDNPHYFSFLYTQSNLQINLSFCDTKEKNYKPFEIYKNTMLKVLADMNYSDIKQKDIIIALWAYVHGISSLATMKNVYYDEDWNIKIGDFIDIFKMNLYKTD